VNKSRHDRFGSFSTQSAGINVRSTSDTDRKFNVLAPLAKCHEPRAHRRISNWRRSVSGYGQPSQQSHLLTNAVRVRNRPTEAGAR
jgi:hypothetical protein